MPRPSTFPRPAISKFRNVYEQIEDEFGRRSLLLKLLMIAIHFCCDIRTLEISTVLLKESVRLLCGLVRFVSLAVANVYFMATGCMSPPSGESR
jgi:hypothetical protein